MTCQNGSIISKQLFRVAMEPKDLESRNEHWTNLLFKRWSDQRRVALAFPGPYYFKIMRKKCERFIGFSHACETVMH